MRCPFCSVDNDKVIDSRPGEDGDTIRRRRECLGCAKRFTTYERYERTARLVVVKRDGSRVPYEVEKLSRGLHAACGKRPIREEDKERLCREVEEEIHRDFDREVESSVIGQRLASKLRELDPIAYIRFVSEHFGFGSIAEFAAEMASLQSRPRPVANEIDLFPVAKPKAERA
ncbi:MAG: transcriptional regulator NrdR [Planctomycetes bacterium]|nr:transcriptional regulator NrdR [Planctomycetota bacterium]